MNSDFLYSIGDLVELARFGFAPQSDEDRVYGTVIGRIEPIDYFVPRYKVRIQYKRSFQENPLDEFVCGDHDNQVVTVMEYDIAGKIEQDSQDKGA